MPSHRNGCTKYPKVTQLLFKMDELSRKLNCTCCELMDKIEDSSEHTVSTLMDKLGTVHGIEASNKEVVKEVCHAEMVALTRQMIEFRDVLLSMQSEISSLRNRGSSSSESQPEQNGFKIYSWGGQHHHVPEKFMIPQDTPMALWRLWIYGDLSREIGLFRFIQSFSLTQSQKCQLSKVRRLWRR